MPSPPTHVEEPDEFIEPHTHSFVVKLWLEQARPAIWRGHITHVASGQRAMIDNLADVGAFLSTYLQRMGVRRSRLRQLMKKIWR